MRDGVDKEFAARLRRQRQLVGLTQEELGQRLGVSHQTIRSWEQGHLPRCRRWAALAECLSTSVEDLFLGVRVSPPEVTSAGRSPADAPPTRADVETTGVPGPARLLQGNEDGGRQHLVAEPRRQGRPTGQSGSGDQRAAGFGQRLRALRRAGGYSTAEFATRLGVTWQAVQIWEKGESLPQPALWGSIAAILGTTVPELLHGPAHTPMANSAETDAKRVARLVVAFAACDRADQDLLIHQAERLMQRE